MPLASAPRFFAAIDSGTSRVIPPPPPSGVRLSGASQPSDAIRALARKAEALDFEPLAFELFCIASRLDATGQIDVARRDLDEAALEASAVEGRFYRRAACALVRSPRRTPEKSGGTPCGPSRLAGRLHSAAAPASRGHVSVVASSLAGETTE